MRRQAAWAYIDNADCVRVHSLSRVHAHIQLKPQGDTSMIHFSAFLGPLAYESTCLGDDII